MKELNKTIEKNLEIIYEIDDLSKVPEEVLEALYVAQQIARKCGGDLVSRQVIANIVINFDRNFKILV